MQEINITEGFTERMEAIAQRYDNMADRYRRMVSMARTSFWSAMFALMVYLGLIMLAAATGSWFALFQALFACLFAMRAGPSYGDMHESAAMVLVREADAAEVRADIAAHQALAQKLQCHFALDTSATPH
jgi:hypothetical protein